METLFNFCTRKKKKKYVMFKITKVWAQIWKKKIIMTDNYSEFIIKKGRYKILNNFSYRKTILLCRICLQALRARAAFVLLMALEYTVMTVSKYLENNAQDDNSVTICFKIILRFFWQKVFMYLLIMYDKMKIIIF